MSCDIYVQFSLVVAPQVKVTKNKNKLDFSKKKFFLVENKTENAIFTPTLPVGLLRLDY